jgi:hydroxyethylthiazole kinase-like uncharacterized protein yjeF
MPAGHPDRSEHHHGDDLPPGHHASHNHREAPGAPDIEAFSAQSLRSIDADSHRIYGIPPLLLMENAARELATCAVELLEDMAGIDIEDHPPIAIYCGTGNNGADGLAAARHLHNAGAAVMVIKAHGEMATDEGKTHLATVRAMGLPVIDAAADGKLGPSTAQGGSAGENSVLVVDALLGTGLTSAPRPAMAALINRINQHRRSGAIVLAADIPSGMIADTGETPGPCVKADATITFAGLKLGFLGLAAQPYVGNIAIGDIGAPRELLAKYAEHVGRPPHFESLLDDAEPLDDHGVHPGSS